MPWTGYVNTDFSVDKNWRVWGERVRIQFRLDFFNLFNHANFTVATRSTVSRWYDCFQIVNCGPANAAGLYQPCSPTNNIITRQTYNRQRSGQATEHEERPRTAVRLEDHLLAGFDVRDRNLERQCLLQSGTAVHFCIRCAVKIRDSLFVFCTSSSSVRIEAVSALARVSRCRSSAFGPASAVTRCCIRHRLSASRQQSNARPAARKKPPAPAAAASADDELPRRSEAQRAAVRSGDPAAIEQTSRKVTALALREMAGLRAASRRLAAGDRALPPVSRSRRRGQCAR